jgi:AraC-like DNA-binding protein
MTPALYQSFKSPGIASHDRFESWRSWCAETIDVPMRMESVRKFPFDFEASVEALAVGDVDLVEHESGPAVGTWTREAAQASGKLRLMLIAPSARGIGACYGEKRALDQGTAVLISATDGLWHTEERLHGIQVNVPREAIPVTEAQLAAFNDPRRLPHDPIFAGLVRPALLGLSGRLETLGSNDVQELRMVWVSLLAMLTRSLAGADTIGIDTAPARWLQVRSHIRANLSDPGLSPASIADDLFISRSTLYASLPEDSEGIAAEIRRQRLARARAMLQDPTNAQSIAEIAASVGLLNHSRFTRVFRDRYAATPRQTRAEAAGTRRQAG